jgi:hypothetical protein
MDKFAFDTKQVGVIWMMMGIMLILVQGGHGTQERHDQFGTRGWCAVGRIRL